MKQNIYDNEVFFKKYMTMRESGNTYNDYIEQPAIKSLLPNLKDKKILDIGCGNGDFAKYCIEKGGKQVIGVDISKNMIETAQAKNSHENIKYICEPIENLDFQNGQFDIIISSLAIHYVADYHTLIKRIHSFLKKDGIFLFSAQHPFTTSRKEMDNWIRDDEGNRLHYAIDDYQDEGKREIHWFVEGVVMYHRTFSTIVNTLLENGFTLEKVIEPTPTAIGLEKMPKLKTELRRPSFIIIKAKK